MSRRGRVGAAALIVAAMAAVLVLIAVVADRQSTTTATVADEPLHPTLDPASDLDAREPATASTDTLDPERTLRSFTIAATGDFLLHMPVQRRAAANAGGSGYSFAPMLAETAPLLAAADLALCHMETPVSSDNRGLTGYPLFNVPREIARDAAAAGYDGCSTASNHSIDRGTAGVASTLDVLDAAGLRHAGTARSALEAATPTIYDVQDVKVAHLSFTYGTNGIPLPVDAPWSVNVIEPAKILADARGAREAGASFVIVSLQWGNEYQSSPTPEQQALARELLASPDVDLIIGSHVHVVQPIEKIGDKYVAYGVGNFLSNQGAPSTPTPSQDGMILQVLVTERPDGTFTATRVDFTPTWVERSSYTVTLASPQSNPRSYDRTVAAVTSLGPLAYDGEARFTPLTRPAP